MSNIIFFIKNNFTKPKVQMRNVHDNTICCLLDCCINMELGSKYVQVQSQNVITVVEADDAATPYTISPKRKMLKCSWRVYNIIYSQNTRIIGQSRLLCGKLYLKYLAYDTCCRIVLLLINWCFWLHIRLRQANKFNKPYANRTMPRV